MTTNNSLNTCFTVNTAQELLQPIQTTFFVAADRYNFNVTGNGTVHTMVFDLEKTDIGNNFDGTSTFTAPVTGKYLFKFSELSKDMAGATSAYSQISTTLCDYTSSISDKNSTGITTQDEMDAIANMDAADTAVCKVMINGVGADVSDIGYDSGGTDNRGFYQGILIS